jgi:hypothetical protein
MSIQQAALRFVEVLDQMSIHYVLVGSLTSSYYGIVRNTFDADFILQLGGARLHDIAQQCGAEYVLSPQPGFEIFTGNVTTQST